METGEDVFKIIKLLVLMCFLGPSHSKHDHGSPLQVNDSITMSATTLGYGNPIQQSNPTTAYGTLVKQNNYTPGYGNPVQQSNPTTAYGTPVQQNHPTTSYGTPVQQNHPTHGYGTPVQQSNPTTAYGTPVQQNHPITGYGTPAQQNHPTHGYGTPVQQNHGTSDFETPVQSNSHPLISLEDDYEQYDFTNYKSSMSNLNMTDDRFKEVHDIIFQLSTQSLIPENDINKLEGFYVACQSCAGMKQNMSMNRETELIRQLYQEKTAVMKNLIEDLKSMNQNWEQRNINLSIELSKCFEEKKHGMIQTLALINHYKRILTKYKQLKADCSNPIQQNIYKNNSYAQEMTIEECKSLLQDAKLQKYVSKDCNREIKSVEIETLKEENEILKKENKKLKDEISLINAMLNKSKDEIFLINAMLNERKDEKGIVDNKNMESGIIANNIIEGKRDPIYPFSYDNIKDDKNLKCPSVVDQGDSFLKWAIHFTSDLLKGRELIREMVECEPEYEEDFYNKMKNGDRSSDSLVDLLKHLRFIFSGLSKKPSCTSLVASTLEVIALNSQQNESNSIFETRENLIEKEFGKSADFLNSALNQVLMSIYESFYGKEIKHIAVQVKNINNTNIEAYPENFKESSYGMSTLKINSEHKIEESETTQVPVTPNYHEDVDSLEEEKEILIEQMPMAINNEENIDSIVTNLNNTEEIHLLEGIPEDDTKEELSKEDPYNLILMNNDNNRILEDLTKDTLNGDISSEEIKIEEELPPNEIDSDVIDNYINAKLSTKDNGIKEQNNQHVYQATSWQVSTTNQATQQTPLTMRTTKAPPKWETTAKRTTVETTTPKTTAHEITTTKEIISTTVHEGVEETSIPVHEGENIFNNYEQKKKEHIQATNAAEYFPNENEKLTIDHGENLPTNFQENLPEMIDVSNSAENVENLPMTNEKYNSIHFTQSKEQNILVENEEMPQKNEFYNKKLLKQTNSKENLLQDNEENILAEEVENVGRNNVEKYASYTYPSIYGNIGFNDPWVEANFQS